MTALAIAWVALTQAVIVALAIVADRTLVLAVGGPMVAVSVALVAAGRRHARAAPLMDQNYWWRDPVKPKKDQR